MSNRAESLQEIGKIVATHGLRGDFRVRPSSGDPDLLLAVDELYIRLSTGETLVAEPCRQSVHKGQVLLRLHGFDAISQVEKFVGATILLPEESFPELAEDEYYWRDLQGLQVYDREKGALGELADMFTTAAHDTYVVRGQFGEVLIPAVKQFIQEIDLQAGVMKVDLPEGLIPEDQ